MSSFRKPYTVKRHAAGSYVNGVWVEGAESTVVVLASVQVLTQMEIDVLPEGRRIGDNIKIYTDVPLYPARQTKTEQSATNADLFLYNGRVYEIVACPSHHAGVIPHYKAFAVEVTEA